MKRYIWHLRCHCQWQINWGWLQKMLKFFLSHNSWLKKILKNVVDLTKSWLKKILNKCLLNRRSHYLLACQWPRWTKSILPTKYNLLYTYNLPTKYNTASGWISIHCEWEQQRVLTSMLNYSRSNLFSISVFSHSCSRFLSELAAASRYFIFCQYKNLKHFCRFLDSKT